MSAYQASQLPIQTGCDLPSRYKDTICSESHRVRSPVHQQHHTSVVLASPRISASAETAAGRLDEAKNPPRQLLGNPCTPDPVRTEAGTKHHAREATAAKAKPSEYITPHHSWWASRLPLFSNSILSLTTQSPSGGRLLTICLQSTRPSNRRRGQGASCRPCKTCRRCQTPRRARPEVRASTLITFEWTFADPRQPPANTFAAATPA
jgi:hypothetical protein